MTTPSQYYLYISDQDSVAIYPSNTPAEFLVELLNPIPLKGSWECAVLASHVTLKWLHNDKPYYLCCDLVAESYCEGENMQVLLQAHRKDFRLGRALYARPEYHDVITLEAKLIRFSLKGQAVLDPDSHKVHFTLHLRRKGWYTP